MWPDWVFHALFAVAIFLAGILCLPVWQAVQTVPGRIAFKVIRWQQRKLTRAWRRVRMTEAVR